MKRLFLLSLVNGHEYVATVAADKLTLGSSVQDPVCINAVLGLSCLILWATFIHYFKRLPNIYALAMTLVKVASR